MRKLTYILFFLVFSLNLKAQFEVPRLSQYLNNGLANNPAYAGSREVLSLTSVGRTLYQGFEGSPKGFMVGVHSPMKEGKVALGGTIESKSYPGYKNTGIYGHYAYRIWFRGIRVSFGLRAGLYNYALDYSELDLLNPTDPSFTSEKGFAPNFGTGIYAYTNTYFVGFSVPYLLNLPDGSKTIRFDPKSYKYLLTGGYLHTFSESFKLKTTAMFEMSKNGLDIQGGFNYIFLDDKLWLGTLYRTTSRTLTSLFEFQVTRPMRLGIAYDYSFTNISRVSNGSFEIMFRYEFNFEANVNNPFYF